MLDSSTPLDSLRRPAYTGSNRCWPCTVLNAGVAVAASGLVAAGLTAAGYPAAGAAAALGVLVVSTAAIWLRGYLVPGTPTLTARYFPQWLLEQFGKAEPADVEVPEESGEGTFDPERLYVEMDALEECRGDDLCLTDGFRTAWWDGIAAARDRDNDANHERLVAELGLDEDLVENNDVSAHVKHPDRGLIVLWPSRTALLADVAATEAIEARFDGWSSLAPFERMGLLHGLRAFLGACPECEGDMSFDSEPIPSCCSEQQVVTLTCDDCESRLIENTVQTDDLPA